MNTLLQCPNCDWIGLERDCDISPNLTKGMTGCPKCGKCHVYELVEPNTIIK